MGQDRINAHDANAVDYIIGVDTSCLMHMEGILRRQGSKVQVKHIVEILNHA
jgi:L-lactate dehydrogenase complex protein LldE